MASHLSLQNAIIATITTQILIGSIDIGHVTANVHVTAAVDAQPLKEDIAHVDPVVTTLLKTISAGNLAEVLQRDGALPTHLPPDLPEREIDR